MELDHTTLPLMKVPATARDTCSSNTGCSVAVDVTASVIFSVYVTVTVLPLPVNAMLNTSQEPLRTMHVAAT